MSVLYALSCQSMGDPAELKSKEQALFASHRHNDAVLHCLDMRTGIAHRHNFKIVLRIQKFLRNFSKIHLELLLLHPSPMGHAKKKSIMAVLAFIACSEARRSGNHGNFSG